MRGRALAVACVCAALALALGAFVLKERQVVGAASLEGFPLDDAWIHFQFARNLAEGRGFSYNPGVPVSGSTAPLWTLLLGGAFALVGSHLGLAKGLGVASTLATALLAGRLAEIWTASRGLGLLAAALTALSGPMVWGALSGMEVSLAAALVTGGLVLHAMGRCRHAAGVVGLAALARPEAVVILPLLWLSGPVSGRAALAVFAPAASCLAPWVAFNLATAGTPLPATAVAKIEGGLVGALSGIREPPILALVMRPWQFESEWVAWLWQVHVLVPILLLPGLWLLARRSGRTALAPACVLLVHPIAMALLAPYRGPAFQEGRYSIHLLPLAIVVAVLPLTLTLSPVRRGKGNSLTLAPGGGEGRVRGRRSLGRAAAIALLAGALVPLPAAASRYAWAVQNIEAMHLYLGRWVAGHTPAGARLALNDVGAITYVSRREIVDVMGLVTPAIIPYRRDGEAGVLRYLEGVCPDYLIVFPAWFPALAAMTDRFTPLERVALEHNTVAGADEMVVYETAWNRWRAAPSPCPTAGAGRGPGP